MRQKRKAAIKISPEKVFELSLTELQPSQLYISEYKLRLAREWFNPDDKTSFDPIPVKLYGSKYLMTDGHIRAVLAKLAGWKTAPIVWDDDPLDMLAYAEDVRWCDEAGIKSIVDLSKRIVVHNDYEIVWHKRCFDMIIPPYYAAVVARYGGLDDRRRVIILQCNEVITSLEHNF